MKYVLFSGKEPSVSPSGTKKIKVSRAPKKESKRKVGGLAELHIRYGLCER